MPHTVGLVICLSSLSPIEATDTRARPERMERGDTHTSQHHITIQQSPEVVGEGGDLTEEI